ncbi:hypothetical protein MMC11_005993 [Xylographa trunciseda]|nr:hypothetical protein [Xylographa trunciseda]
MLTTIFLPALILLPASRYLVSFVKMPPFDITPPAPVWVVWLLNLRRQRDSYKEANETVRLTNETLQLTNQTLQLANESLQLDNEYLKALIEECDADNEMDTGELKVRVHELETESATLKGEIDQLHEECSRKDEQIDRLMVEAVNMKDKLDHIEEQSGDLDKKKAELEAEPMALDKAMLESDRAFAQSQHLGEAASMNESLSEVIHRTRPLSPYPSDATTVTASTSAPLPTHRHYLHKQGAQSLKEYLDIADKEQTQQETALVEEFIAGLADTGQKSEVVEMMKQGKWSWTKILEAAQVVAAKAELKEEKGKKRSAEDFGM